MKILRVNVSFGPAKMFYQYDQLFTVLEHREEIAGRFSLKKKIKNAGGEGREKTLNNMIATSQYLTW